MTQPLAPIDNQLSSSGFIQCDLCLQGITIEDQNAIEAGSIKCGNCGYNQPTTKRPRFKDMALFGICIASVYVATIIGILVSR